MCRAVYFRQAPGDDRLLLVFHHLVADAASCRILIGELQYLYSAADRGEEHAFASIPTGYVEYANSLRERANQVSSDDLAWWLGRPWDRMRTLPADDPTGSRHVMYFRKVDSWLDEENTRLFTRATGRADCTSEEMLVTALAITLAGYSGTGTAAIEVLRHGRIPARNGQNVMRTVGWIATFAPYLIDLCDLIDPCGTGLSRVLSAAVGQIRATQARELSWGALRYLHDDAGVRQRLARLPSPGVRLNYRAGALAISRSVKPPFEWVHEHFPVSLTPDHEQSHDLKIHGDLVGGRLRLSWLYSNQRHREQTVQALADRTHENLRGLVRAPDLLTSAATGS